MSSSDAAAPRPRSLEQQRKLAKDLLRAARAGDAGAIARIRAHRTDADPPLLAHAQLAVAREAGFPSWRALADRLREEELKRFVSAVRRHDREALRGVLASSSHVRAHVNDPLFDFGQRAAHMVADDEELLDALIAHGADLNLRSDWQNGPYTVLDRATDATARFLVQRGASLTPNVAARLGWFDELHRMVEADPAAVHQRGGDGQQPLHEAKTPAIADYLLEHGAEIDARCIDHQSTPAQYALVDRPDVCRRLLERGALPDIFMAAHLGDAALAERLIDRDPSCLAARTHQWGYAPVPAFNTYCWSLGFLVSPHEVAARQGHRAVYDLLVRRSSPRIRLLAAAMAADEPAARAAIAADPSLPASLTRAEHGLLALAIFSERIDAAGLMLRLGFDPRAPGRDGGTALHAACWVGHVRLVEQLLRLEAPPLDVPDPTHGATPVSWAVFGSVHRRARGADYVGVIDRLVAAGASVRVPGNSSGRSLLDLADGNADVQAALLRHLAG
jgi:ankyrin repeat protein